jgi:DhnA family fructose-bisphosphate aldolase class Ia
MVKGAMEAGGAGASIGRNVFQHKFPAAMVRAIAAVVHNGATTKEAADIVKRAGK